MKLISRKATRTKQGQPKLVTAMAADVASGAEQTRPHDESIPEKTVCIPRRAKAYSRHVENTDGLGFRAQIHIKGKRENTPSYAKRRTGCE